jgi:ABC-type nitrate/sulfonate/bicarbonate transport system permease component
MNDRLVRYALGALGFVILLALWEAAARAGLANPVVISSPSRIATAFVRQWSSGDLLTDIGTSAVEFGIGFGMAIIVGVALGLAMGMNRFVEYAIDPFVWFVYASPLIAFYPLLIVWLGFGFATVVAVAFLLSFVSIAVNTLAGVHAVDASHVRAVAAFGGSARDVVFKVVLPASVPHILAGARIGLGRALHGVVLGEMFGSNDGLGFSITRYASQLKTAEVFVPLLTLVVFGVAINQASGLLERRLLAWRQA